MLLLVMVLGVCSKYCISMESTAWRSRTNDWCVWHISSNLGNTSRLLLNLTNAQKQQHPIQKCYGNSTTPTSSVFSIWSNNDDVVNGSSATYVAYCFADVKLVSASLVLIRRKRKCTDGAFVYTGFKPAFVMFKRY